MSKLLSGCGLMTSPIVKTEKYDRWWSYMNSNNPQPNRYESPYPDMMVVGRNPAIRRDSIREGSRIQKKKFLLCDPKDRPVEIPEKRRDPYALDIILKKSGSHGDVKLQNFTVHDNHLLKLRDLEFAQEVDGGAKKITLGELYVDCHKFSDGDDVKYVTDWEVEEEVKEETKNDERTRPSWVQFGGDKTEESQDPNVVHFGKTNKQDQDHGLRFSKQRRRMDGEEGSFMRTSVLSTQSRMHNRPHQNEIGGQHLSPKQLSNIRPSQATNKPDDQQGGPRRSSMKGMTRHSEVSSVTFLMEPPSTATDPDVSFESRRKSNRYHEAAPLLVSRYDEVEVPRVMQVLLSSEVNPALKDHLTRLKIANDERQEGFVFRMSFASAKHGHVSSAASNVNAFALHPSSFGLSIEAQAEEDEQFRAFLRSTRGSVSQTVGDNSENNNSNTNRRNASLNHSGSNGNWVWKMYSFDGGRRIFGLKEDINEDRTFPTFLQFIVSSKATPEDDLAIITRVDGSILGFYRKPYSVRSQESATKMKDSATPKYRFVFDTKDRVIGFIRKRGLTDFAGDVAKFEKKKKVSVRKRLGLTSKFLKHIAFSSQFELQESWPMNIQETIDSETTQKNNKKKQKEKQQ